jgi:hypothetical protein
MIAPQKDKEKNALSKSEAMTDGNRLDRLGAAASFAPPKFSVPLSFRPNFSAPGNAPNGFFHLISPLAKSTAIMCAVVT